MTNAQKTAARLAAKRAAARVAAVESLATYITGITEDGRRTGANGQPETRADCTYTECAHAERGEQASERARERARLVQLLMLLFDIQ